MQSIASKCKRSFSVVALLSLAILLVFPITASAEDEMDGDSIFASIRVYEGVDPADQAELARLIGDGFLPIMRDADGFVGYFQLSADDVLVTISLFDTKGEALASNDAAREFVAEYLAPMLPESPRIVEGAVDLIVVPSQDEIIHEDMDEESSEESDDDDMMMNDDVTELYAALRIYDNYDLSYLDEANDVLETILLPAQMDVGGFFGYFAMNDGDDSVAGLSIYDSEENALAANEIAASVVAEYMAEWLPPDPLRINGQLGVAGLTGLNDGENLVGAMMMDEELEEESSG